MSDKNLGWRPSWWSEEVHGSAWDRVKEALRRDWTQTKHDLHLGGHEMNQSITDTVKQAAGKEHLPSFEHANPPKVIGEWSEAETPYRYGHAARAHYGALHTAWSTDLETKLRHEWETGEPGYDWDTAKPIIRRGYETPL